VRYLTRWLGRIVEHIGVQVRCKLALRAVLTIGTERTTAEYHAGEDYLGRQQRLVFEAWKRWYILRTDYYPRRLLTRTMTAWKVLIAS
jgi:hypothetical protein